MTHPTEPRVEVTQADRAFMANLFSLPRDLAEQMFGGEFDGKPDVASKLEMIATFRTAAEAANRDEVERLRNAATIALDFILYRQGNDAGETFTVAELRAALSPTKEEGPQ